MNTQLYALLLTLICATGAVQASERNKGNNPAGNNSTEQPTTATLFPVTSSIPLLSALAASDVGRRLLGCGTCPNCTARTSGTTQSNQDRSAHELDTTLEGMLGNAERYLDTTAPEQGSPHHSPRNSQGSPRRDSFEIFLETLHLHAERRAVLRDILLASVSSSAQGSPRHGSLSPKGSPSQKPNDKE